MKLLITSNNSVPNVVGADTSVMLVQEDGEHVDLTKFITGLTLDMHTNQITTVTLELMLTRGAEILMEEPSLNDGKGKRIDVDKLLKRLGRDG